MSHPQFISVSVSPSSLSLSSSSLFCSPPALSKLYFLFRIVGNLFRPSSPILRMVLTIVTNAPPTPTQNSGDVSVPMTCMASPVLPLRAGFLDGHMRSINVLGGGGKRGGGEGGHKDSWNSYPCSQVKASGSTTSTEQPKIEIPGHRNSY